jgi:hypothetical protein
MYQGLGQWVEALMAGQSILENLHLRPGATEADAIVPVQNGLMDHLGKITDAIRVGRNPTIAQLQAYLRDVYESGEKFKDFVLQEGFTDRRASGQALNTVMPYIDGTCGYPVPLGGEARPSQQNCVRWGGGTLGGDGSDGMVGAIQRAIILRGGQLPPMQPTQGSVPQLTYPPYNPLPQAGTLPSNRLPPAYGPLPAVEQVSQAGFGGGLDLTTALVLGAGMFFLLPRRQRG